MSEFDATDIDMLIITTLVARGFTEKSARGVVTIVKRRAWSEGYESGRAASYDYREVLNPYG